MDMKADIERILEAVDRLRKTKARVIVAIDGRCASGKTTLAEELRRQTACTVFHTDDFFLRPEQRTPERFRTPGGNVDYERLEEEILLPLRNGADQISSSAFDCQTQTMRSPVRVCCAPVIFVEGSYSCHPALTKYYDMRIFLQVSVEEQAARITKRNGMAAHMFFERWIPLEEEYFSAYQIEENSDLRIDTTT